MGQPVSDGAVEFLGACVHSLRFSFGTPIGYPYTAARPASKNPPPAQFRRVQVATPPPYRGDVQSRTPWATGLTTITGPFNPSMPPKRLSEVRAEEGALALGQPDPKTILLDVYFDVPLRRKRMAYPGPDRDRCFLSIPYWSPPIKSPRGTASMSVKYFDTYRLPWTRVRLDDQNVPTVDPPAEGDWIAISFDAFWPLERDSADVIARVGECDSGCSSPGAAGQASTPSS